MKATEAARETASYTNVLMQLERLEFSMRQAIRELDPVQRLTYLNGLVIRMTSMNAVSASADKIEYTMQQRSPNVLSDAQREQVRRLAELTSRLYDASGPGGVF